MISVLIPVYNYNIAQLVSELHGQLINSKNNFEIICIDDCSTIAFPENENINLLTNTTYVNLDKNIGRSAIRNLLAKKARYEILLFLDADTMVIQSNFIETYLKHIAPSTQIIYGGICYQKKTPSKEVLLRWVYGKHREALSVLERNKSPYLRFLTLNFIIKKDVFNRLKFNENIPNLRHEDTLFALDAQKNEINVQHIDNPVLHLGLESSKLFLKKSIEATEALKLFVNEGLIKPNQTSLSNTAHTLVKFKISFLVKWLYKITNKTMKSNLLSNNPSLLVFDLYRLGYYLRFK